MCSLLDKWHAEIQVVLTDMSSVSYTKKIDRSVLVGDCAIQLVGKVGKESPRLVGPIRENREDQDRPYLNRSCISSLPKVLRHRALYWRKACQAREIDTVVHAGLAAGE
eukprot:jgi/Mesvir1/13126/Mv26296-RA.1